MKLSEIDIPLGNAIVMQMKVFNARLDEEDMKRFAQKAAMRGLSLTGLLREWIHEEEGRTMADLDRFEAENFGRNKHFIRRA